MTEPRKLTQKEINKIARQEDDFNQALQMIEDREYDEQEQKSGKKRARGHALIRLCKASARVVRDHSGEIVKSLYAGVLQGDVSCAKMLVTLIEKLPPPRPRRPKSTLFREFAIAQQLASPAPSETDDNSDEDDDGPYGFS